MPLSRNAQIGFRIVGCALTSSGRKRRSPLPTFAGDCNAPTTYFDETTTKRSGRPKHAKGSGTAHRQTVSFESGRTNQNFVRHQRTSVNCRGRDKKGFSDRGSYGCRYRKKLHRDHQCLEPSRMCSNCNIREHSRWRSLSRADTDHRSAHYLRWRSPVRSKAFAVQQMG